MKKLLAFAAASIAAGALLITPANAGVFVFKGDSGLFDSPTGNIAKDCGTIGVDLCTDVDALGFTYSKDGIIFTATAFVGSAATQLIQDIFPNNSGLGALSENDNINDQTQFDSGESIEFAFTDSVWLRNIEFNSGNDTDCSAPGSEGPCGSFDLYIDSMFIATIAATDLLTSEFFGTIFEFVPITVGAGFAIAKFEVSEVPIPGALPLLLSGLAGLGFASRRKKKA